MILITRKFYFSVMSRCVTRFCDLGIIDPLTQRSFLSVFKKVRQGKEDRVIVTTHVNI